MSKELEMAKLACHALDDKKGKDIKVIDIHEVSVIADYFVIASASNQNQVQAMVDNVDETLGRAGYEAKQIEGTRNSSWVLMDYGDMIVHVFDEENRLFYDLERIWRDGKVLSTFAPIISLSVITDTDGIRQILFQVSEDHHE